MNKKVDRRLGCVAAHGGEEAIKHHSFFRSIDWDAMENRKVKPPFRPKIVSIFWQFGSHPDPLCSIFTSICRRAKKTS
jgi:hypothetical protein